MKADNGNQQFWGRWSGSYDGFMGSNSSLYEEMALRMKRRLSRQMCVLELACGTGLISQRLAGSVKSLEATDYAPEMRPACPMRQVLLTRWSLPTACT